MPEDPKSPSSPLDAFLSAFWRDVEHDAVRPLAEYLALFPADDEAIAQEYRAVLDAGSTAVRVSRPTGSAENRLGHYRILRPLGRGGQATVYLAKDVRLERSVALKVLDPGPAIDRSAFERFRREAEITSKLDHPGICTVYETGEDRGVLWIAMRYVEGDSLAKKISTAKEGQASSDPTNFVVLSEREGREDAPSGRPATDPSYGPKTWTEIARVLALFEEVARTLHVAHEHGVIHRDIKPGNLIVTKDGEPVILDFGLAQEVLGDQPTLTLTGDIMGTPAYMSPEQIAAQRIRLDRRTDVYSLGVSLFECLTLKRPFDAPTQDGLYQAIMTKDPPDPRELNPAVPGDLKVVLEAALEKDRDRRYQTALDFAEDIRRVRMHEPILAKPAGPLLRLRRWSQRSPALATALVGIVVALVISIVLLVQTSLERDAKNSALNLARAETEKTEKALQLKDAALQIKDAALQKSEGLRLLAAASSVLPRNPELALLLGLEGASLAPDELMADTTLRESLGELRASRTLVHHRSVCGASFSPDGRRVVTASLDKTARIWDAETGKETTVLRGHDSPVFSASFSPDGRWVVTASEDKTARIWDAETGKETAVLRGHDSPVLCASFSPVGRRVVTASEDKTARIWDAETGKEIAVLRGHEWSVSTASFSPDGRRAITASHDTTARIWDAENGKQTAVLRGHAGHLVFDAKFSSDGRRVVTAASDTARIWDPETGKETAALRGHESWVLKASFSPDGRKVVTASLDKTARIWDPETRKETAVLRGHEGTVSEASFSPDGRRVVTASAKTARIWDPETAKDTVVLPGHEGIVSGASFSPDGRRVVTASDKTARIWDAENGKEMAVLEKPVWNKFSELRFLGNRVLLGGRSASFSPDGRRVVTASEDKTARIWDSETGKETAVLRGHEKELSTASFSPGGRLVVTASEDKTARIWDADSGKEMAVLRGHRGIVSSASFSPDRRRVITASQDKTARIWDADGGKETAVLRGHDEWVRSASFSPDGRRVVTASEDKTARIWDADSGKETAVLRGHDEWVRTASFSPDGRRVVTASDKTARIWDADSGKETAVLRGHDEWVQSASFSPDGRRVVTASDDKTARIWDADSGKETAVLRGHHEWVRSASFSPDGRRVVTASRDKTARIWAVDIVSAARARRPRDLTLEEVQQYAVGAPEDRAFVHDILDQSITPPRMIEKLERATLRDSVLKAGILEARLRLGDPDSSLEVAWTLVQRPGCSETNVTQAIELVEWARSSGANAVESAFVRGVALLRLGKPREALETMTQVREHLRPDKRDAQRMRLLAAIAMCQHELGRDDEADTTLEPVENLKAEERQTFDAGSLVFLNEARSLIHGTTTRESRPSSR